mmetsp:Transcript_45663/g.97060  ORF Transcript_45663/g.97060 Transcript_45663/m.97060 type:complete len:391 (-) Transcript_45663:318-1490(-)
MLVMYYIRQKAYLGGYLACRMIRISLQYGHCDDTVFALSIFSSTLSNQMQDIDEGYALARTTLSLLEFYDANRLIPRVYGIIYGTVLISKDPVQSLLDPLLRACRLSFSNGNFEYSTFNTIFYITQSWNAGKKIPLVVNEVNAFAHQHKQQGHMPILQLFLAPFYKMASSLSGISLDSSELIAQLASARIEDIVETAKAKNEILFVETALGLSMVEGLYSRNFAQASQMILKYRDPFHIQQIERTGMSRTALIFYTGLVSFHMARETREPHWIEKGASALARFEQWSMTNEWNNEHCYLLLKAEQHYTKREADAAIQAYHLAVESIQKHRFVNHLGLTCELAAHCFGNIGAKEKMREMIQKSHDAYMEWGAARKAKAVLNLLEVKWLGRR